MTLRIVSGFVYSLLLAACVGAPMPSAYAQNKAANLEQKLETIVRQYKERYRDQPDREIDFFELGEHEDWVEMVGAPCKYLPEAVRLIQSKENDVNKDTILISTMWSLPLKDYVTTWGPAVVQAYLNGRVRARDLSAAIFLPMDPRTDAYLGYQEEPVRQFYTSILNNKRIAVLPSGGETIGTYIPKILDGSIARTLKIDIEHHVLGEGTPVDLTTTCTTQRTR